MAFFLIISTAARACSTPVGLSLPITTDVSPIFSHFSKSCFASATTSIPPRFDAALSSLPSLLFSSISALTRSIICSAGTFKARLNSSIVSLLAERYSVRPAPVSAVILLTPDAMLSSFVILNPPIVPSRSTCVPPQNSLLNASPRCSSSSAPTATTRTVSPYFSPNSAIAPSFRPCSIGISTQLTGRSAAIFSFTSFSISAICSLVSALGQVKSNRK